MEWNVVVTTYDHRGLRSARRFLERYGSVERTRFYNVLLLKVPDVDAFQRQLGEALRADVTILNDISRVIPVQETFCFDSVASFETNSAAIALCWAERLAGRSFHVRLHERRGAFPIKLPSIAEEKHIDDAILRRLADDKHPGRIDFSDPDFVIDIETVAERAGMSIWSRRELAEYPFLQVD